MPLARRGHRHQWNHQEIHPHQGRALEVFLILLSAADAEDYSEMSLTEIVKLCGYSRWKVQACLSALEKSEYIIRELKGIAGHTMVYKLLKSI